MQRSTWTIRTFDNGEVDRQQSGLSHDQAIEAIRRAMRGEDPLAATAGREVPKLRSRGARHEKPSRVAA